ncbi:MAG: class I SAM-dependent methyltransferase, partial [Acidobacteria bacterium]|nr:class I SAM-dependent methyltransferase [Acidobacteriota bacterium]
SPSANDIIEGNLICSKCNAGYPITNGIPRFVEIDNYASSFGYQWNLFRKEQIDSINGTTLSADRFWSETDWDAQELDGKWVLDAGCGAGRFLDIATTTGAQVVGIDISNAIDAAQQNLDGRPNAHFVQASIYELPFADGTFDYTYCIGVIQHTPDPAKSLEAIAATVKPGGKIAVTIYPRKPWTKLYSKYWFRPITKRLSKETLLNAIRGVMPVAFPLTNVLFRIPYLNRGFRFVIPIANYVDEKQLTRDQRYSWAILDTFDMLSPSYDQPMTEEEASSALGRAGIETKRHRLHAINLVGTRG